MGYVIVGFGGACGSLVRFILGKFITERSHRPFPYGTLIINISGALLLGFISNSGLSSNLLLLMADGFLGAYTTFSTFMFDGFTLFKDKKLLNAVVYMTGTVIIGLIFYWLGMVLAKLTSFVA